MLLNLPTQLNILPLACGTGSRNKHMFPSMQIALVQSKTGGLYQYAFASCLHTLHSLHISRFE